MEYDSYMPRMEKKTTSASLAGASVPRLGGLGGGSVDRLELLRTLVAIVEAGSLSAAAVSLATTQPTVSRRLQQLERALGRGLLKRSTHKLALSEDGERCYQRAKEVLAGWSSFEADFAGGAGEPEGLLRVVVPHAFGQQLLVGVLAEYLRRYPKVSVEWSLRDAPPDFIADGIDCAILVGEAADPLNVAVRLADVPRIVVAAPSLVPGRASGLGVRALAELPWLSFRPYYQREVELRNPRTGELARLPIRPRFSTDNLYALRDAARRGLGAAVLSSWVVGEELAEGSLLRLASDWSAPSLPLNLLYPYARFYPPKLRRFVETFRELVGEALGGSVHAPRSQG